VAGKESASAANTLDFADEERVDTARKPRPQISLMNVFLNVTDFW
jgi:hypothetical protein